MKVAHCINNNGERIEKSAHDINYKRYLSRLTCPYCGKKVDWINGNIQEKEFRAKVSPHKKASPNTRLSKHIFYY